MKTMERRGQRTATLAVMLAVLLLAVALPAQAGILDGLDTTAGLVAEDGSVKAGLAAHFSMDVNGDASSWLKAKGDELWDSGQVALQIAAIPTVVAGHVVEHSEMSAFCASDADDATTGLRVGFGAKFAASNATAHIAVGWKLDGGKPTYFFGWKIL